MGFAGDTPVPPNAKPMSRLTEFSRLPPVGCTTINNLKNSPTIRYEFVYTREAHKTLKYNV